MEENIFYGEFIKQEKDALNELEGQWVFWKVFNEELMRNGFYAWNFEWPKDNRIMAGDFVEFHGQLHKYEEDVNRVIGKLEKENSKPLPDFPYHPVGTFVQRTKQIERVEAVESVEVEVESELGELEEEIEFLDQPSGPQIDWKDIGNTPEVQEERKKEVEKEKSYYQKISEELQRPNRFGR